MGPSLFTEAQLHQQRIGLVVNRAAAIADLRGLIDALSRRGCAVHVAIQEPVRADEARLISDVCTPHASISIGYAAPRGDGWASIQASLANALDCCRYLHPDFDAAPDLRQRAKGMALPFARHCWRIAEGSGAHRSAQAISGLMAMLRGAYAALPADPGITAYLRQLDLDILLLSDLTGWSSPQADYSLAARRMGLRCAYLVDGWAALTVLGDIKSPPDRVLVWNTAQASQAARLHGLPPHGVQAAGALAFDVHCDPSAQCDVRPCIVYADLPCPPGAASNEPHRFVSWLQALRDSDSARLREVRVSLLTHPRNFDLWKGFSSSDPGVSVRQATARRGPSQDDLPDDRLALRQASALVGGDPSMVLSAGLAGVPAFTIPDFQAGASRDETLAAFGLSLPGHVSVIADPAAHLSALAQALDRPAQDVEGPPPAALELVRPAGAARPALDEVLEGLENLLASPGGRRTWAPSPWRPLLSVAAAVDRVGQIRRDLGTGGRRRPGTLQNPLGHRELRLYRATRQRLESAQASAKEAWADRPLIQAALRRQLKPRGLDRIADIEAELRRISEGDAPILFGPWLSGDSHEILYWIPFLRWYRRYYKIEKRRIVLISQGGVSTWYQGIFGRYVDVFDMFGMKQFQEYMAYHRRLGRGKRAGGAGALERAIQDEVADRLGIAHYKTLPTAILDRLIVEDADDRDASVLSDLPMSLEPLQLKPQRVADARRELPGPYVVVQFRFNELFPDTPENRAAAESAIEALSRHVDLVTVVDGFLAHRRPELDLGGFKRVRQLRFKDFSRWRELQTAVAAGAEAFVGSYDDMAAVALYAGKKAYCLVSRESPGLRRLRLVADRSGGLGERLLLIDRDDVALSLLQGWDLGPKTETRSWAGSADIARDPVSAQPGHERGQVV